MELKDQNHWRKESCTSPLNASKICDNLCIPFTSTNRVWGLASDPVSELLIADHSICLSQNSDKTKTLGSLTQLPCCGRQLHRCSSFHKPNVPARKSGQNPTAGTVSNILLLFNCTGVCAELFAACATKYRKNNWTHACLAYILGS